MSIHVLGFSGSLRRASYNSAALRAAVELVPEGMTIETFDLSPIPFYNEDLRSKGMPEPVRNFRDRITAADALLIATPEYNYSIPGVLKNALDWASRPDSNGFLPLDGKPIAIMGASPGNFGTVRGQLHLRQVFVYTNSPVVNKPEVLIFNCKSKFDEKLRLKDETTRGFISDLLVSLAELTRKVQATPAHG